MQTQIDEISIAELPAMKNPVIMDTNFLFITFQFRVDIIAEIQRLLGSYTLIITSGVLTELERLSKSKEKNKKFVPLVFKMLVLYKFRLIISEGTYVDKQILDVIAASDNIIVATNDRELRKKVKGSGRRNIFLRQKSYLELE